MIPASQAYIDAVNSNSRQWNLELTVGGAGSDTAQPVPSAAVKSCVIHTGACGENFAPGAIYLPYLELELDNRDSVIEKGDIGRKLAGVLSLAGVTGATAFFNDLFITDVKMAGKKATITANCNLAFWLEETYTSALTYPATIDDILAEISTQRAADKYWHDLGYRNFTTEELAAIQTTEIEQSLSGLTFKQVFEIIGSLIGGFVTTDYAGVLTFARWFGEATPIAIPADRSALPPEYAGADYAVTGLRCIVTEDQELEDGTIIQGVVREYGSPVNVNIQNSFMTTAAFEICRASFVGLSFEPGTVQMDMGNPLIEPFDYLVVTDIDNNTHVIPCLQIVQVYTGGLSTSVTAEINTATEQLVTVAGPVQQAIKQMERRINNAQRVATTTNQYFWHYNETGSSENGAHVTEKTQEDFLADPANGGGNTLITSNGVAIRDGQTELATFTAGSLDLYTENGSILHGGIAPQENGLTTVREIFAVQPMSSIYTTSRIMAMDGEITVTDDNGDSPTYELESNTTIRILPSAYSTYYVVTYQTSDTIIDYTLGTAGGDYHADNAVSESLGKAYGINAHAENNATAAGNNSHASGDGTVAIGAAQAVFGRYNKPMMRQYANISTSGAVNYLMPNLVEIGNGTAAARSNAFEFTPYGDILLDFKPSTTTSYGREDAAINTALTNLGWTDCII